MQLESLVIFKQLIEEGNLSKVAEMRGVNTSSISRTLQNLEEELGFSLFNRTTRRLQLTEPGQVYALELDSILPALQAAQSKALEAKGEIKGKLKVTMPLGYAESVVLPLVPKFRRQYPDIHLELMITDECLDLEKAQIHSAIRFGRPIEENWVARPLQFESFVACVSPDFLSNHVCKSLADFADLPFISFLPGLTRKEWFFSKENVCDSVHVKEVIYASSATGAKTLCLLGEGVTCLPAWLVQSEVDKGELQLLMSEYAILPDVASENMAWLMYPALKYLPQKAKVWNEFLLAELSRIDHPNPK